MRKSPFKLSSADRSRSAFFGICCLALFLLVPAFCSATSTQASIHHSRAGHRVHSTARRTARGVPTRRARVTPASTPKRSAALHRTARSRHRTGRRARARRARRYRLDATLDNIRTHTTPTEAAAATGPEEGTVPGGSTEAPRPPALVGLPAPSAASNPASSLVPVTAASGAVSSEPLASQRDVPFLNAVPRYMPAALRGSHEVLLHQNVIADVEGLSRIQNDAQLSAMVHSGDLVALPASSAMVVDPRLPLNRRYCRPWTAKFLTDLSRAHQNLFGHPLQLTSAVRTIDFQRHLARYNGNAAPAYGDTASPHLTGQAIDLGKKGMSLHEIAWMRGVLGQMQNSGKLDVEEEFEQACFHISVYKTYAPRSGLPQHLVASAAAPAEQPAVAEATPAIGGLARPDMLQTVSEPVRHRTSRRTRSYSSRNVRHTTARRTGVRHVAVHHTTVHHTVPRHHRRRHASMALIAARMR